MRKSMICRSAIFAGIWILIFVLTSSASESADQIRSDLAALWLVTVEGESRTRTFEIQEAIQRSEGEFTLFSTYGWSDGFREPVNATARLTANGLRIELITPAKSIISVEESGKAMFTGTFKNKKGEIKKVVLERQSRNTLGVYSQSVIISDIQPFLGKWTGTWEVAIRGPSNKVEFHVEAIFKLNANNKLVFIWCQDSFQGGTGKSLIPGSEMVRSRCGEITPRFRYKYGKIYIFWQRGNGTDMELHVEGGKLIGETTSASGSDSGLLTRFSQ
ncbi:MAG TPA: hypothetical protein PK250_12845 [Syntrophobacter fumaroxidans]|nr:hypothetical protein [Syntrophobacter fumaroxidans]